MTAAPLRCAVGIWAALALVLAAAVAVKVRMDVPWFHVMGDPATTTGWPFFVGFVSNVGAMLWTATATVFLVAWRLRRSPGGEPGEARFLLASGLFVALLGIDDLFLLHDQAFPDYLGIRQTWVLAAYGALGLSYAWFFRARLRTGPVVLFAAAMALLASSVALDQLMDRFEIYLPASGFLEDAAKLLGIGTWLAYALARCLPPSASPAFAR